MYFSSIFFKKNVPKGFYKRKFYDRSLFMVRKLQSKLLKWDRFG